MYDFVVRDERKGKEGWEAQWENRNERAKGVNNERRS